MGTTELQESENALVVPSFRSLCFHRVSGWGRREEGGVTKVGRGWKLSHFFVPCRPPVSDLRGGKNLGEYSRGYADMMCCVIKYLYRICELVKVSFYRRETEAQIVWATYLKCMAYGAGADLQASVDIPQLGLCFRVLSTLRPRTNSPSNPPDSSCVFLLLS